MLWIQVSLDTFFDRCVPGNDPPQGHSYPTTNIELKSEKGIHDPLRTHINDILKGFNCRDLIALSSRSHPDKIRQRSSQERELNLLRPDIALYPNSPNAQKTYPIRSGTKNSAHAAAGDDKSSSILESQQQSQGDRQDGSTDSSGTGATATITKPPSLDTRVAWAWAELLIEVKKDSDRASFDVAQKGDKPPKLPSGKAHRDARGQVARYGREIFNRQHRQHLFMLSVVGHIAHILRLDTVGVIVSEPFNYLTQAELFGKFLYRFINMTPEQRGHNPTARRATPEEHTLFRSLWTRFPDVPSNSAVKRGLKKAATDGWPIYALDIYALWSDPDDRLDTRVVKTYKSHRCLVGRPDSMNGSMTGRMTRGFVAWDTVEQKAVYVKDSWRPVSSQIPSELENYQRLLERVLQPQKSVYFLTLRAGGDVVWSPGLRDGLCMESTDPHGSLQAVATLTQELVPAGRGRPFARRNCRLIFKEICRPLEDFSTAAHLVGIVYGALIAHGHAWTSADLLHRDVSVGNILIYDKPEGGFRPVLADWDLAKTKETLLEQKPTQNSRSGTWQFLSAVLQCYPQKPYQLSDDLESFLHVLNWCSLRYLKHGLSGRENAGQLAALFFALFDKEFQPGLGADQWKSHIRFKDIVQGWSPVPSPLGTDSNAFTTLLQSLTNLCRRHYQSKEVQQYLGAFPTVKCGPMFIEELIDEWADPFLNLPPNPSEDEQSSNIAPPIEIESPLKDHVAVMTAFRAAMCSKDWPESHENLKRVADQVPRISSFYMIQAVSSGNASSKRTSESVEELGQAAEVDISEPPTKRSRTNSVERPEPRADDATTGGLDTRTSSRERDHTSDSRLGGRSGSRAPTPATDSPRSTPGSRLGTPGLPPPLRPPERKTKGKGKA
ncbi:hypothetical protein C8Q79DRAFT_343200 [Trametes meyenii]|nr:hypothetical protein C8Q79DRAFT_343200 [Trametes meyenii]